MGDLPLYDIEVCPKAPEGGGTFVTIPALDNQRHVCEIRIVWLTDG